MLETGPQALRSLRQGDILRASCGDKPSAMREEAPENQCVVLAGGERIAHSPSIAAGRICLFGEDGSGGGPSYRNSGGTLPIALTHQERAPLTPLPANYRIVQQHKDQACAASSIAAD